VTGHKDLSPVLCAQQIQSGFLPFSKDAECRLFFHIIPVDFCMAAVRCEKYLVKPADKRIGRAKHLMRIDTGQLLTQQLFPYSPMV